MKAGTEANAKRTTGRRKEEAKAKARGESKESHRPEQIIGSSALAYMPGPEGKEANKLKEIS